ncbi:MAG: hypothetical protein MUC87_21985 [Bacteroidia bacterium]|jgi:hypothetical protein|nr:hypothetical protein [Bacteroidia bacterium]
MSVFLPAIYTLLLLWIIVRSKQFRYDELHKRFLPAAFLLKIAAGTALWYIYTYYYTDRSTSDIWKYFDDSGILFSALQSSPTDFLRMITGIGDDAPHIAATYYQKMNYWYQQFDSPFFNDGRTMIRLNALLRLLSFGNYHVHTVIMSFLSLIGLNLIYKILRPAFAGWRWIGAVVVFLLPSVLFWGSGVLKEGLLWLCMGVLLWALMQAKEKPLWLRVALTLAAAWLMAATRLYVLAAVIPALGGWWLAKKWNSTVWKPLAVTLAAVCVCLLLLRMWPATDAVKLVAIKRNDFINLARGGTYMYDSTRVLHLDAANRNALIRVNDTLVRIQRGTPVRWWRVADNFMDTLYTAQFTDTATFRLLSDLPRAGTLTSTRYLQPGIADMLRVLPEAMFSIVFRPLPHEMRHLPLIPAAAENLLLLALLALLLRTARRTPQKALTVYCVVFVLLLLAVTGITTPVTGAAVRYKSLALPFLFAMLMLHINPQKLPAFVLRLTGINKNQPQ